MKIKEAWRKGLESMTMTFTRQGHPFTYVGWKSPTSNIKSGPILVTISGNEAIEVTTEGVFKDAFPATADHYFPWNGKDDE